MELNDDMLRQIMPNAPKTKRAASLPILNQVMRDYDINNERRTAAWLATLAAESGELKYQQELASGAAYEGRRDLGNTQPGDGKRYKGHGRIQITGRANHSAYTNYLKGRQHLPFVNFIAEPHRLADEPYATDSAGWFWAVLHDLNSLADRRNFLKTQTTVNGRNKNGYPNHWVERKAYYERALRVLPNDFLLDGAEPVDDNVSADLDEAVVEEPQKFTEEEKGVTTGEETKPASIEGTPPPIPAVPVVASRPSLKSIIASIIAFVMAPLSYLGIDAKEAAQKGAQFAQNNVALALKIGAAFVFVILAYWIWNKAMDRAHQRTLKVMDAAADQTKNNLRLVDPVEQPPIVPAKERKLALDQDV